MFPSKVLLLFLGLTLLGCLGGKRVSRKHRLFLNQVTSAVVSSGDTLVQLDSVEISQLVKCINSANSMGLVKIAIKKNAYLVTERDTIHLRLWDTGFKWKGDFGYKVTENKAFFKSLGN